MAIFSYLKPDNLYKHFKDSEKAMSPLFDNLHENERLAQNRPHPAVDKSMPKVTDGTLAAIIQETPKRIIQQLPNGVVKSSEGEWLDIFASWKLNEDIIPHMNCQADPLQKSWRGGSYAMTYGSCPAYVFMDVYNGELRADFKLPYITHVYLQKGKVSSQESKFAFVEGWYQESDIDYIIAKEKELKKQDPEYVSEWDVKKLEEIKTKRNTKSEDQKNPQERKTKENTEDDGIRIIHAFQDGIGAKFYSFVVEESGENSEAFIVRTKVNPDPRGKMPLPRLYYNIDLFNPVGRSVIDMSGGMQNLLDSHTQSFQYRTALEIAPPVKKRGNIPKGTVKFVPYAVWDMGDDKNNDVEVVTMGTSAFNNFPNTYGLIKSQILNLNNSSDTSISAESGNPGFSKTDAGVNAMSQKLGVSDNYFRKQYEGWWNDICETALNLTFAETKGTREEKLDKDTADRLRKVLPEGNEVIIWDENDPEKVYVDYDLLGVEPLYFEVDSSSSQVKEDNLEVESLTAVKELVVDMLPVSKRMSLANKFVYKLGVEDPEEITFSEEEIMQAAQMEQMQQGMAEEQMAMQGQMAGQPSEEELAIEDMRNAGMDDGTIEEVLMMMQNGASDDDITAFLTGGA